MLEQRHPEEGVRSRLGQLDPVEGLRALAITLVVLFHYTALRDPAAADPWVAFVTAVRPLQVLVSVGYLGVDLFFLLTGFLLVLPWALHAIGQGSRPNVRDFYVRRVRRIVPAYYVQLAFLFAAFLPLLRGLDFLRFEKEHIAYNGIVHALFLHYTTPLSSASFVINGPLWSLALEAQYYLLLPLLAPLFMRAPLAGAIALCAGAATWRVLANVDMEPLVRYQMELGGRWAVPESAVRHLLSTQLPGYLGHFAAGMLVAIVWLRMRGRPATRVERAMGLAGIAAALALIYWVHGMGGSAALGFTATWLSDVAALACLLLAVVRALPERNDSAFAKPWLFVSRVSYSAYLYHLPLLLTWNHFGVLPGNALSLPAYLALVLAASWLSYRFVERPFMGRRTAR